RLAAQSTESMSSEQAIPTISPANISEAPSFAYSPPSLPSTSWLRLESAVPPASPSPPTSRPLPPLGPLSDRRLKGPPRRNLRLAFLLILIILLIVSTVG